MDNDLASAFVIYISACVSAIFNVPVLRQSIGFVFLSFIPGYLLIRLMNLGEKDRLTRIIFSAGLSIALLMFSGVLLNEIGFLFNISSPLSNLNVIITTSGLTLPLFLLNYGHKHKEQWGSLIKELKLPSSLPILALLVISATGVVGAVYHNSLLLIFMIIGIATFLFLSVFLGRSTFVKIFPIAVLIVGMGLLFYAVLTSRFIFGSDAFLEFYVYRLTEIKGFWSPPGAVLSYSLIDSLNSMLSITVLPTFYTVFLGTDGETIFKFLYPFFFGLIPVVLYKMYDAQTNQKVALLSSFFFMATPITFYGTEPLSLNRQILGQFFFVLSMFLIFEKNFSVQKKRILLMVFASALIVSHYSLAYFFLFYAYSLFIFSEIGHRYWKKESTNTRQILTPIVLVLITALTFGWYVYVSDAPFNHLVNSIQRIASLFTTDFLNPQARGSAQGAVTSLLPTVPSSLVGSVHKILIYADLFFIGIGLMVLLLKSKKFTVTPEFRLTALVSITILILCFAVPNFSATLNTTRFYSVVLPFLAPFFALGVIAFVDLTQSSLTRRFSRRDKPKFSDIGVYVATVLLIFTFLFQVGLINYVTQDYPYSYTLDLDRKLNSNNRGVLVNAHTIVFYDEEVFSAKWLQEVRNTSAMVYADENSRVTVLKSYALLPDGRMLPITNETLFSNSYMYLKYVNVQLGVFDSFNMSDMSTVLQSCNEIYSNGESIVYFAP
jgi:uncharacterized membrane protein